MKKKIVKIVGILFAFIIIALVAIPYFFEDQIKAKILESINKSVDAKVSFVDADLSLFSNFPKATISIEKLKIINKAPFEGDTLVYFGELNLEMSLGEIFKSKEETMNIKSISTSDGLINIKINKNGVGNFDIALKNNDKKEDSKSALSLKIKSYKIENYAIHYFDESSKIKMQMDSLYHSGTGDFTATKLDLDTKSSAKISLDMDKMNYMKNVSISLDAILGIDLEKQKYSFKQNKALINKLPLEFDGSIQLVAGGQNYDLKFKTPTSSFQNFLGLLPASYSKQVSEVRTTGDFSIVGVAKGLYSEKTVPKFTIAITSDKASFQYPNLPKSVRNICINTRIINETGVLNDTYINLEKLSFSIDKDVFDAKANIKNITENPLISASLKGTINLANLSKAYPIKIDKPLSGVLSADVSTKFDMQSVEKSNYQNIDNSGTLLLSDFNYTAADGKNIQISKTKVRFNPSRVSLEQFSAKVGKSDINVTGVLDNFYGFLFKKQELKGNFNLQSNQLAVADFMSSESSSGASSTAMKIPSFLNCTLSASINSLQYDNLILKDATGKLVINDQKASMQNIKTSIFGGTIGFNGFVSTKTKIPDFAMDLKLNQVEIQQAFSQLNMLKKIAPIANVVSGKFNSMIAINGNLDVQNMTPDMNSVSGNLMGQLQSTSLNAENSEMLKGIASNLKFIDLKKINLDDVKVNLMFKNGSVVVAPFDIKYQDIKTTVSGTHGFDQAMNYNMKFDVPAKYLGKEATQFMAKLADSDVSKLNNVPINASITGTFKKPKITTDMKSAVSNLVKQLANQQKDKLINQGKSALDKLIMGNKPKDSTKTNTSKDVIKDKANELIKGFFGKKK
jgi:hypothetical protein